MSINALGITLEIYQIHITFLLLFIYLGIFEYLLGIKRQIEWINILIPGYLNHFIILNLDGLWLYIIMHRILSNIDFLSILLNFHQFFICPSHLHQILFTLEISNMLENILCELLALVDDHLVPLLVLNDLQVHRDIAQHVLQHHLGEVVCVVVHHAPSHLGQHADLAGVGDEGATVGSSGDFDVALGLLYFLQHRLQLQGEVLDLGMEGGEVLVGVVHLGEGVHVGWLTHW